MQLTWIYITLFLSVLVGGIVVLLLKPGARLTKLLLAFSGAYILAICFLHLMPELYHHSSEKVGLYVLAGFFLQIMLELFSKGAEHGHAHHHGPKGSVPVIMLISLCLHAFLEGMPLGSTGLDDKLSLLLWGIVLHKIPIAITLMTLFVATSVKISKAIGLLVLFGIMAPTGAFVSNILELNMGHDHGAYFSILLGVIVGILLHISTTILFESSEDHRFNLYKFAAIVCGAGVALFV